MKVRLRVCISGRFARVLSCAEASYLALSGHTLALWSASARRTLTVEFLFEYSGKEVTVNSYCLKLTTVKALGERGRGMGRCCSN